MTCRLFVDTGAWIAVTVKVDRLHRAAALAMKKVVADRSLLVTSDYVLSETLTRIRYDAGHSSAIRFLSAFDAAVDSGGAALVRVDDVSFSEARRIFSAYADQDFSFVDCTSFALARSLGLDTVFGFDHHFSVMGFKLMPAHGGMGKP